MPQQPNSAALSNPFPPQQAYLAIEQQPVNAAEQRRLLALRRHVQAHTHTTDLRGLAGAVKKLLGPGYEVGCGSAHIWVQRAGEQQRLAVVADRLTTAYRDWFEPLPDPPATSRTSRRRLSGGLLDAGPEQS
ncbi:hypothetical protein LJ737_23280 [Hymenobacter sp. 15J16-1T3B]|uniref:hypothetical protein n=1 Tax=unclassified Hymenobacter TaxID=2615202 RepID=UPI001D102782|nr:MULTISPECIES: hypothetical protein [unclassified Hymenobacter]MCC3160178.1 hypothetical protein [Hymenobacter sp. 15J16-1T3B]UYZ61301.1 hypothetical protein OIS50_20220 [Hymenobacter sp. YIM 151858-1]